MPNYYVNANAQSTGEHEVHEEGCSWLRLVTEKEHLGHFNSCHGAIEEAKSRGYNADGCKHCSPECHTR